MGRSSKSPDYLLRFWLLALVVTLGLLLLYFLPDNIFGWEPNKVDLLSDLRREQVDSLANKSEDAVALSQQARSTDKKVQERERIHRELEAQAKAATPDSAMSVEKLDSTIHPTSILVDMTPAHDGLQHFFAQLRRRSSLGRPVRIAVLGDSFIEGDIFTSSIRSQLQARYGGSGVGWLPLTSETAGFRRTVRHEFKGWKEYNQLHSKGRYPLPSHYYTGSVGDWVRYTLPKGARPCNEAVIYYKAPSGATLEVSTNSEEATTLELPATETLSACRLASGSISSVRFTLTGGASGFVCYGVSLDGASGVSVDNFSIRGNSGLILASLDAELNKAFFAERPYDLIVLQYGLNTISPKQLDYSGYTKQLGKAIDHLRAATGRADYLLLGVSDRGVKASGGAVVTMPAALALERAQIRLSADKGVVFWSTREAVGRLGGIGKLASKGWAAKDYTHLSHRGGGELARQFLDAFFLEEKYYDAIK